MFLPLMHNVSYLAAIFIRMTLMPFKPGCYNKQQKQQDSTYMMWLQMHPHQKGVIHGPKT